MFILIFCKIFLAGLLQHSKYNTLPILKELVAVIDEPKLYAEVDSEKLMYQWKGHILDEEAEKGFLDLLDLIKRHGLTNVVADVSKFKGGTVSPRQTGRETSVLYYC